MKVKWWFFFYRTATVTDTDIYHIKDLEDYGDIVLKNIYPFHKRGKQLLVLLNGFALTNVGSRPLSATYWTEYEKRQVHTNLSLCMC